MLCEVVGPPRVSYCWANNMGFLTLISLFSDFCGPHLKKKHNLPRWNKKIKRKILTINYGIQKINLRWNFFFKGKKKRWDIYYKFVRKKKCGRI